jgi:imidazolonepropionase
VLVTMAGPTPRVGPALSELGVRALGAVAARDGRFVWVGADSDLDASVAATLDATMVDARGAAVLPGFVDAHTHLAFAGDRDDEVRRRLAGATYQQIAADGGGIVRSVRATRRATREALTQAVCDRLDEMLLQGTTTAEVKSGYGLDTESEVRSLEAIEEAARRHPMTLVPTFLGAHEVPPELRADREAYLRLLTEEMIPLVAQRKLARFCDVFCEPDVFTVDESRRILIAARRHGLGVRVHADELAEGGGAELAAETGARSADHLVHVSPGGMRALAEAGCAATLLPAAAFYLRLGRYAPARALVEAGVPVALATDANPGGGLSPSIPFAMTVGCFAMGLSLEEAIAAATLNGAYAVGLEQEVGSVEVGKRADLVVMRSARMIDLLRVGVPAIRGVVKAGKVVAWEGRRGAA